MMAKFWQYKNRRKLLCVEFLYLEPVLYQTFISETTGNGESCVIDYEYVILIQFAYLNVIKMDGKVIAWRFVKIYTEWVLFFDSPIDVIVE